MILLVGDPHDAVLARVRRALAASGAALAVVDERATATHAVERVPGGRGGLWRVSGAGCPGTRPVDAIFVRHRAAAPAGTAAPLWRRLLRQIDPMLAATTCLVVNRPSAALSHYSKPLQLMQLAAAGFAVPRTLVTQRGAEALAFVAALRGQVVIKGVSCVRSSTLPFRMHDLGALLAPGRPLQIQEYVAGDEFRVTVVGCQAFANAVSAAGVRAPRPASELLPAAVVRRCIAATREQGLVVAGIDLRRDPTGRVFALELNPYPLLTHYETAARPVLSDAVARTLLECRQAAGDVLA